MQIKKSVFVGIIFLLSALLFSCKSNSTQTTEPSATEQSEDTSSLLSNINTESALADDEVFLKLAPQVGKNYNSTMAINYDMVTNAMGQEMKSNMKMNIVTDMKIIAVDGSGNSIATASYKNMTMNMDMGIMKMSYESGKPATDEMSKMMAKTMDCFINMPLTLTMTPEAKVQDVKGMDAIQKKMLAAVGDSSMANMQGINDMSQNIEASFAMLPNKAVKIGDTWQQEIKTDVNNFPMLLKSTYTLVDRKEGVSTITIQSTMRIDQSKMSPEQKQQMGLEDITMTGSSKGSMEVEELSGWTISSTITQDMKMEITAQGQKVPMTMKGTMVMKPAK